MAVKIRLARHGAKKAPFYRIVVADSRSPRDGRFIDRVGSYDPRKDPSEINVDEEKARDWLSKGAQPSDAVESLFRQMGTRDRYDRFKAGEEIEKLLEEYKVVEESRNVTSKTRVAGTPKKAVKAEAAPAEKVVEEAPAVEKEAAPVAEVEETPAVEEAVEVEEAKEDEAGAE